MSNQKIDTLEGLVIVLKMSSMHIYLYSNSSYYVQLSSTMFLTVFFTLWVLNATIKGYKLFLDEKSKVRVLLI